MSEDLYKKAFKLACETLSKQENDSCYYCVYEKECFNKEHFRQGACPPEKWEEFYINKIKNK